MHQPLFGALIPLLIAAMIYAFRRGHASLRMLMITPAAMAIGAVWAVIPDVPRLLGAHALYQRLASDPRMDIFLWHYSIDRIETQTLDLLGPLFNSLFAIMILLLIAAAWRELSRAETSTLNPEH
jgi:hypothetical protein